MTGAFTLAARLRRTVAQAALALGLLAAAGPLAAGDRALIIGINDYIHPGTKDLRQARGDALKMQRFAVDYLRFDPAEVVVLLDQDATGANVRRAIQTHLVEGTGPGDRVMLYYSGHGSRIPDRSGDEDDQFDEVLMLADANLRRAGFISDDEMEQILAPLRDRQALLLFDSCNSGTIHRQVDEDDPEAPRMRYHRLEDSAEMPRQSLAPDLLARSNAEAPLDGGSDSRLIWTAAAPSQLAWEDRRGGLFTHFFLEGLTKGRADGNRNGRITNSELHSYVKKQAEQWCARNERCSKTGFTPTFTGPPQALAGLAVPGTLSQAGTPPAPPPSEEVQVQLVPLPPLQNPAPPTAEGPAAVWTMPPPPPPPLPEAGTPDPSPDYVLAPITPSLTAPSVLTGNAASLAVLTDLFPIQNSAGLQLGIRPGQDLRIGDTVAFHITATRPGHVVLLDLDPEGNLAQLFPSRLSRPGVTALTPYQVLTVPEIEGVNGRPLQITVTEPAGRGQLLALLVEGSADPFQTLLPPGLAPGPIPNAAQVLAELAHRLNQVQATAEGNAPLRWSAAYADYVIRR